jgi:hypothetical protein
MHGITTKFSQPQLADCLFKPQHSISQKKLILADANLLATIGV